MNEDGLMRVPFFAKIRRTTVSTNRFEHTMDGGLVSGPLLKGLGKGRQPLSGYSHSRKFERRSGAKVQTFASFFISEGNYRFYVDFQLCITQSAGRKNCRA